MAATAAKLPVLSFLKYLIVGSIWFLFVRRSALFLFGILRILTPIQYVLAIYA
jgi:hypothetical protein